MEVLFDKLLQSRLDVSECLINVLSSLRSSEHDFARSEYQQTNFRFLHVIDQARKGVGVKVTKDGVFTLIQLFKLDLKIH